MDNKDINYYIQEINRSNLTVEYVLEHLCKTDDDRVALVKELNRRGWYEED